MLLATPETAAAIASGRKLAFLVGSYDGSGNFGDIAQLDAALGLLDRLDSGLLVLPVIERRFAASHEQLRGELIHRPEHVLYFDDGTGPGDERQAPLEPPGELQLAVSYLYGGGFLNPSWGERKLSMLSAVEEMVAGAERVVRVASGQQVDAGWIAGLGAADVERLRRFELWGARDDISAAALAELTAAGPAVNTGDDAIGILKHDPPPEEPGNLPSRLEVNVHFAEHEWVTDRPERVREFDVQFLAELSRLAGRPPRVRPLLAYLDPRIDERPGLERFASDCAAHGIEVAEPVVLRSASIGGLTGDLRGAALTISSSYHVALTSLLLAVPAAILRDNDYYAQKARGLLADFGLPEEFSPRSTDDPLAAARALVPHLLDPPTRARTRRDLGAAAARVRQRRLDAEGRLRALIAGDGSSAGGPEHEIAAVRRADGELSFEVRLEGVEPKRIWLRTPSAVAPSADAALAVALMPAMRTGGTLRMEEPVSARVLRMQSEFQGIQRAWSQDWTFGDPPLRQVEVLAPTRPVEHRPATGRVAAFFSGGVDSFSTVLGDKEVTDLIFVRGLDILPRFAHQEGLAERVEERLREAAGELGLPFHLVDTNLRDLSEATGAEKPLARWEAYYNSALVAVALFLEPLFDRVLISTEFAYDDQLGIGSSWMVDQLWGTENMEIADAGGLRGRVARIERIADHPVARKTLRVCWQNPDGAYNCGRCRKCVLTMATLEAAGQLRNFETFPAELDLDQLDGIIDEVRIRPHLLFCEEALEAMRRGGRPDLERAIAQLVVAARRKLGLEEDRLAAAERRRAEAEAKLEEVLGSRSWQITAPLRRLTASSRAR